VLMFNDVNVTVTASVFSSRHAGEASPVIVVPEKAFLGLAERKRMLKEKIKRIIGSFRASFIL